MELEKPDNNNHNILATNSKSMEILQRCHEQVLAVKLPKEPSLQPVGILSPSDGDIEIAFSFVGSLLSGAVSLAIASTVEGSVGATFAISVGAVSTLLFANMISAFSNKSLAYRAQVQLYKMGMFSKKRKAVEAKNGKELEEYSRQMAIVKKKIVKINKQVQPELERINAQSKNFVFEFGMDGLVSTRRNLTVAHPSFVDLAAEIGR